MKKEDSLIKLGSTDRFVIGEEIVFSAESNPSLEVKAKALDDIRIRIGTLLKTDTVSFLLGAGASVDCGGQLIGSVPLAIERELQDQGTRQGRVRRWLKVFYLAARRAGGGDSVPIGRDAILERRKELRGNDPSGENPSALPANFEQVLAQLHRWRSALPDKGGRLRIDGSPQLDVTSEDLDACLQYATRALARACDLPTTGKEAGLETFTTLLRKLLTRPLNLKRVNLFTLNYDTLVEQAADAEGVVLLDGFIGTQRRVFRPESCEQDLYFPAETTEGHVHRFDRVLHLYKLHGSITWVASQPAIDNPYGVQSKPFDPQNTEPLLIYPTPAKYGETLGMPYSELFRRFSTALVRPQSVLFVIGYGFGDEHVNAIIRQALAVPSFTLVVVDPDPRNQFVVKLREQKDRRVWIAEGKTLGTISGFVQYLLPDLRDEEVRKKVLATYLALEPARSQNEEDSDVS
ncbi:MAG: SIR2 family protein [Bacillota bacterium]|nr:SIR2 family protein [Bacillota bacterium]